MRTELFVRHLAAYLSATHSTGGQDHAAVIDALLHQSDVGDRINALVHRTWKDRMAYGLDHMTRRSWAKWADSLAPTGHPPVARQPWTVERH